MKQTVRQETFPVFTLEIERGETSFPSVEAICAYFRERIESHKCGLFIADLDHLAHTRSLGEGRVGEGILAARNLIFCFGIALPEPQVLAMRPRSIGVAETVNGFVIAFMETPMPVANAAMEDWARGLLDRAPVDCA